ncbi:MAG: tetratricopeptide repeat protein, partial [Cyanobacteriota bacterium]|nr:tetratricopeptide repeat protein [Cyanobacteriota bacterium]
FDVWGVRRKLVKIQQQTGNLDRAISSCKQAIEINPTLNWFDRRLEDNLSKLEQHDLAINYYRSLLEAEPNNIKWLHPLGQRLVKIQEWDEAIIVYRHAIELEANNDLFHRRLADTLQQKGLLDEAVASYQKAIEINPNFSWSYYNLGETLRKLTKWDEAIIAYRHAIELEANNHLFHRKLADALQQKGLLDEAVASYQKAIEINPKFSWSYYNLGETLRKLTKWDEAIIAYRHAIELEANNDLFHRRLADVLQQKGLLDEAIYNYQKAIEINPKSCLYYAALGNAYIKQQNFSEAVPYLIQALKMRPNNYEVHKNIEYILKKQGRYQAIKIWKSQKKFPQEWLRKFFNFTEDWEVTSDSPQTNITRIKIHSASQIALLPSQTIDTKIHRYFQDQKAKLVEGFVALIPEGRAYVASGVTGVITSDNKLIKDISTGCAEIFISPSDLSPVHYIEGNVAFLSAKWGCGNYFQWMFGVFVRLYLLQKSSLISTIDKFVFNEFRKNFHKDTLRFLGIPEEKVIESKTFPHIKAKQLIVPSLTLTGKPDYLKITKWGGNFLRDLFLKPEKISSSSRKQQRIYISRKLALFRRIVNEDRVVSLLEKFGFVAVTLESMSIEEQALVMAGARVIVTPHGAGLTNLIFCNPGTKVIEIFSPQYINPGYSKVCSLYSLPHYHLICEDYKDDSSVEHPWGPDIVVNLDRLLKILELAGV